MAREKKKLKIYVMATKQYPIPLVPWPSEKDFWFALRSHRISFLVIVGLDQLLHSRADSECDPREHVADDQWPPSPHSIGKDHTQCFRDLGSNVVARLDQQSFGGAESDGVVHPCGVVLEDAHARKLDRELECDAEHEFAEVTPIAEHLSPRGLHFRFLTEFHSHLCEFPLDERVVDVTSSV